MVDRANREYLELQNDLKPAMGKATSVLQALLEPYGAKFCLLVETKEGDLAVMGSMPEPQVNEKMRWLLENGGLDGETETIN